MIPAIAPTAMLAIELVTEETAFPALLLGAAVLDGAVVGVVAVLPEEVVGVLCVLLAAVVGAVAVLPPDVAVAVV
jgi:hypothetical protein